MIEKELVKFIKKMHGSLVGIGIESEYLKDIILKNPQITTCTLLNLEQRKKGKAREKGKTKKNLKMNIKKMRKYFKKKQVEYIICNIEDIRKFLKTFIRDSIYITSVTVYLYGNIDVEDITTRYKRYKITLEEKNYKEGSLLIMNIKNTLPSFWKDKKYFLLDSITEIRNFIADILIN